jgi:antitoxin VapB
MYMSDALHINNAKASRLARKLAKQTGETITDAIIHALEERLERNTSREAAEREKRFQRIMDIVNEMQKLPVLDDRPADEIIGYNENGLFD